MRSLFYRTLFIIMATITLTACVASGSGTGLGDPNQKINYQFSRNIFSFLGNSFDLPNETPENPAVLKQINWFVSHPAYLKRMAEQSRPYLYYILQQVNRRDCRQNWYYCPSSRALTIHLLILLSARLGYGK